MDEEPGERSGRASSGFEHRAGQHRASKRARREKNISHFQGYIEKRNKLAHKDICVYFAPEWCSPWENSLIWIAGCCPSLFFRLVYALSGWSEVEANLTQFLRGTKDGYLGEVLSSTQIVELNALQSKTISEEERLTMRLATLQEDMADRDDRERA